MTIYGQRNLNPDDNIGFSKEPFSKVGCAVVELTNLFNLNGYDLTPQSVNSSLKDAKAFSDGKEIGKGNLLVWERISIAFPFVTKVTRVRKYEDSDNAIVTDAIERFGGCLVEVDGKPIGGIRHWVLFRGKKKCHDPWDNIETSTSKWTALGYTVVELSKKPAESTTEAPSNQILSEQIEGIRNDVKSVQNSVNILYEDRDILTDLSGKMVALEDKFTNLSKLIDTHMKDIKAEVKDIPEKVDESMENHAEVVADAVNKKDNVILIMPEAKSLFAKLWRLIWRK